MGIFEDEEATLKIVKQLVNAKAGFSASELDAAKRAFNIDEQLVGTLKTALASIEQQRRDINRLHLRITQLANATSYNQMERAALNDINDAGLRLFKIKEDITAAIRSLE
jgi:hypothetical protein